MTLSPTTHWVVGLASIPDIPARSSGGIAPYGVNSPGCPDVALTMMIDSRSNAVSHTPSFTGTPRTSAYPWSAVAAAVAFPCVNHTPLDLDSPRASKSAYAVGNTGSVITRSLELDNAKGWQNQKVRLAPFV